MLCASVSSSFGSRRRRLVGNGFCYCSSVAPFEYSCARNFPVSYVSKNPGFPTLYSVVRTQLSMSKKKIGRESLAPLALLTPFEVADAIVEDGKILGTETEQRGK